MDAAVGKQTWFIEEGAICVQREKAGNAQLPS